MFRNLRTLITDLFLILLASMAALLLRDNLEFSIDRLSNLVPYISISLIVAVPVILMFGLHRVVWRLSAMVDYQRIVIAALVIVLVSMAIDFAYERLVGLSRSFPILQFMLMSVAMVAARLIARRRHAGRRDRPGALVEMPSLVDHRQTVLVVGFNRVAELYLQSVVEFAFDRIVIAGLLGRSAQHTGRLVQMQKVLGTPEEVASVLRELEVRGVQVSRVVVTVARHQLSVQARSELADVERSRDIAVDWFADRLELAGKPSSDAGDEDENGRDASRKSESDGGQLFRFGEAEMLELQRRPYWRVKRVLDAVGALALISLSLPLAPILVLIVAIDVGWPVTFWQQRPGLGGRPFKLYKLRTMGAAHDDDGRRLSDDQRLSGIGRFLRRTRLDELPQLALVLIGHMSFVGPRPLLPVDQSSAYGARLAVRPGLTGWAQVIGG